MINSKSNTSDKMGIMQDYLDGVIIQVRHNNCSSNRWTDMACGKDQIWNFESYLYRRKPALIEGWTVNRNDEEECDYLYATKKEAEIYAYSHYGRVVKMREVIE